MKTLILNIFIFLCVHSFSQNILFQNEKNHPINSSIDKMNWILGDWSATLDNSTVKESWSANNSKSLMGVASIYSKDNIVLFEILSITEEEGKLYLRLRHFDSKMNAWEEKDQPKTLPLLKVKGNKYLFHGYTFEKIGKDQFKVWIQSDEKDNLITITYNRI